MADAAGTTHHILLDAEGYMILPSQRVMTLANQMAAKLGSGDPTYSDLSEWGAWVQTDWRSGMGEEVVEAPDRFYWASGMETRVKNQLTLGPEIKGPYSTTAAPVKFASFNSNWYVGCGTAVRKWDGTNSEWDAVKTDYAGTVTDLCVFDDYLFVCLGEAVNAQKMNTSEVSADAGVPIRLATVYQGYIFRVDNGHEVYYTNAHDGTWSTAIACGRADYTINSITGWDADVFVVKDDGVWYVRVDLGFQVMDFLSSLDSNNGSSCVEYNGSLYLPFGPGLLRYTGDLLDLVGPDNDAGLPQLYNGRIVDLVSLQSGLYAAVDASATAGHKSSVLCYKNNGWHPVVLGTATTERILCLGYESLHDPGRLWFGQSTGAGYVSIPDDTNNPTQQTGWTYTAAGELWTPWFSAGLMEVEKDFESLLIVSEDLTANINVAVTYEVDRSGTFYTLGTATVSPDHELSFSNSSFTTKTTAAGCTATSIVCTADVSGDVSAGEWLRISNEIRQVKTVATTTITLYRALSTAPAAGVSVFVARAAGREIRFKLSFATNSSATSPVVKAIRLKYMAMVRDKWSWVMPVRVVSGLKQLDKTLEARTGTTIMSDLVSLAKRIDPFTLVDLDGTSYTVKVIGAQSNVVEYDGSTDKEEVFVLNLLEV